MPGFGEEKQTPFGGRGGVANAASAKIFRGVAPGGTA